MRDLAKREVDFLFARDETSVMLVEARCFPSRLEGCQACVDPRYFSGCFQGKVMQRYIPESITTGAKQGFSAPDASWFRGESIEYVRELLFDRRAKIYAYLDYKAVHKLIEQHLSGAYNRRLLIWSLLNFEWWCRCFLA